MSTKRVSAKKPWRGLWNLTVIRPPESRSALLAGYMAYLKTDLPRWDGLPKEYQLQVRRIWAKYMYGLATDRNIQRKDDWFLSRQKYLSYLPKEEENA